MSKKAIPLIKGDDTNWNNQQTFSIKLSTSIDLDEGFSAEFRIGNVVKTFDKIVSNKITPILTSEDTASLPLGYNNGILKLFDSEGRTRTVKSNIPFIVKNGVITPNGNSGSNSNNCNCDCCDNDGYNPPEEIDVIIDDGEIVDYNSLANIPTINGVEVKGNLTSADLGLSGGSGDTSLFATKAELKEVDEKVTANSNELKEIKADFVELNNTLEGIETEVALKANKADVFSKQEAEAIFYQKQQWLDNTLGIKSSEENAVKNAFTGEISGEKENFADAINALDEQISKNIEEIANKIDNSQLKPLVDIVNEHGTKLSTLEANKADKNSVYTKEEIDVKENALKTDLQAVSTQIEQLSTTKAEKTELEAVSSNLSNLTDNVATLTNQVSGYGESINDLTSKTTDLENNKASKSEIPTLTSQLTNDSGFISSIPEEYITENDLSDALKDKADITSIPTKISSLENDSGYLNAIPEEYVTEIELESKGYLTQHQDISGKADKTYVDEQLNTKANKEEVFSKEEATNIFYQKQQWIDSTLGIKSSEENAVKNAFTGKIAGEESTFSSAINVLDNQISANTESIATKADKSTTYTKEEVNNLLPSIATNSSIGLVRPDGITITITDDGVITAASTGEITENLVSKEEYETKIKELEQTISQLQEQIGNLTQQVVTLQSNIDTVEDQMLFSGDTVIDDL